MDNPLLTVESLSVSLSGKKIVDEVSFELYPGQLLMLTGPNGAGKTTLVRAIAGNLEYSGQVMISGRPTKEYPPRGLAKKIGVLTQRQTPELLYTAFDTVLLGRYAHQKSMFSGYSEEDIAAADAALNMTGMGSFKNAGLNTLSGGELQRVFLARSFAQDPQILILDEPSNHLDLQYVLQIFELIVKWTKEGSRAAIAVVHDLNVARYYGTHALLMSQGRQFAYGEPGSALSGENLSQVYKTDVGKWMRETSVFWL